MFLDSFQSLKVQCGLTKRDMEALGKFLKKNMNIILTSRRVLAKLKKERCPTLRDVR